MRKKKMLRLIDKARDKVQRQISGDAAKGSKFAKGLAGEGYKGGYRDALDDMALLLCDVVPKRRDYWSD